MDVWLLALYGVPLLAIVAAYVRRQRRIHARHGPAHGALVAARTLDVRRSGAADQRRQIRQEDHPRAARRRLHCASSSLTLAKAGPLSR